MRTSLTLLFTFSALWVVHGKILVYPDINEVNSTKASENGFDSWPYLNEDVTKALHTLKDYVKDQLPNPNAIIEYTKSIEIPPTLLDMLMQMNTKLNTLIEWASRNRKAVGRVRRGAGDEGADADAEDPPVAKRSVFNIIGTVKDMILKMLNKLKAILEKLKGFL